MANTNPGGVDFNTSPYFDDYDEDKKFVRVLYRPGRAIQARELTQMQTYQQAQVKRFAEYFFKQGALVSGCTIDLNVNVNYVKLQTNFGLNEVDVEDFDGKIVFGANSGVKALVDSSTDLEGTDPKTLFVTYQSTGGFVLTVNNASAVYGFTTGNTITLSTGSTCTLEAAYDDPISGVYKMIVSNPVGALTTTTAVTVSNTGVEIPLNITAIADRRANTTFDSNETIFTLPVLTRAYAQSAAERATFTIVDEGLETETRYDYGSKVNVGEGIIYIADHFVKHSEQTIVLDKYTNIPTYKVGVIPNKSFIDYIEDQSLVDNAQGTPNFQAPGADRFKIDTVLIKYEVDETAIDNEFITLIEVESGIIRKRKTITVDGQIEDFVALRLKEGSGNFSVNDPIVTVREHLLQNDNGGRYDLESGGDNTLLLLEVDPFTAYISGHRNQIITRTPVEIEKGLATEYIEQTKTQVNYGNYITVKEMCGAWDFAEGTKIDLYDTIQEAVSNTTYSSTTIAGSKIGEARVRSFDYVSGIPGTPDATYNLYLFDVVINSGSSFNQVRSVYDSATPSRIADIVLDASGRAVLNETSFRTLVFRLPYTGIKTIRDDQNNVESGFRFKKQFTVSFTGGVATISSTDSNETFVGQDLLSATQKNEFYNVVINNNGSAIEATMSGTVSVSAGTKTVSGSSTNFLTRVNIGDLIKIGTETHKIVAIADDTQLTLENNHVAGASGSAYTKVLPPGYIVPLTLYGGKGEVRTVNVLSPGTVEIDIKENIASSFVADVLVSMDRANAREKRKILNYQATATLNPNTHPSGITGPFGLGYSDIYQLHAIYQSSSFEIPATTSNTNVTSSYTFDNGQRDSSYEHGIITPKPGVQPTGRLLAVFDYFSHDTTQGLGYCSVDSYPINDTAATTTTINTADIPIFTSPTSGLIFNLRDCVDWRPIKTANTSLNPLDTGTFQVPTGGLHIPEASSDFDSDLIFYRGRVSKVYLNSKGTFGVNDGVPASGGRQLAVAPPTKPDTLELAEITIPPYPSQPKDVQIKLLKNRRFTMADVGKISDRLERLEYFTALSYLEKQATEKTETDEDGFDRFKNGILVDPFTGYAVADVTNPFFASAIDVKNRYLTAKQDNTKYVDMRFSPSTSTATRLPGNKILLPFTEVEAGDLRQTRASKQLRLVEELSFVWSGTARVVPFVDNFFDTVNDPEQAIVYNDSNADNWRALVDAWNSEIAPLNQHWLGDIRTNLVRGTAQTTTSGRTQITTQLQQTTQTLAQQNAGVTQGNEITVSGDRVVSVTTALWMRQRDFVIHARALKNGSRVYAFFDGQDVTQNCDQIVLLNGTTIEELNDEFDNNGFLTGQYDNVTNPTGNWDVIAVGSNGDEFYVGARSQVEPEVSHDNEIVLIFRIPERSFNVGQREFTITDSPTNSEGTTLTSARSMIFAYGVQQVTSELSFNTRPVDVSFNDSNNLVSLGRRVISEQRVETRRVTIPRPAPPPPPPPPPPPRFTNDPLSQSFYVDPEIYPKGFYVTSIDLFFRTKSQEDARNCILQLREMENGFPTLRFIGIGDNPIVNNRDIQVSEDATLPTTFTFRNPVYLSPGNEYAFCVRPDNHDPDFALWVAELGEIDVTNPELESRIESAYNAGVLFSSSNDRTWTVRQNQDLKFTMRLANFDQNTLHFAYWNNFNVDEGFDYDALQSIIADQILPGTDITYDVRTADSAFNVDEGWTSIKNYERVVFNSRRRISNSTLETNNQFKSLQLRATITTTDRFISPYVDDESIKFVFSRNIINNNLRTDIPGTVTFDNAGVVVVGSGTDFANDVFAGEYVNFGDQYRRISSITNTEYLTVDLPFTAANTPNQTISIRNEENPVGPYASESRYVTRVVELNDGFEASDLVVYLNVNRPPGTGIRVYAKLLNENDSDRFVEKFYQEMTLVGSETFTLDQSRYVEEKYVIPLAAKTGGSQLLAGTVSVSSSSTTVTGSGTRFFEDLRIGDTIAVGTARAERTVTSISSNESLTVDSVFGSTDSGQDAFKVLNNIVAYTTPDGRNFEGYKYFEIKIAFISSNPNYATKVKDLRAIALA